MNYDAPLRGTWTDGTEWDFDFTETIDNNENFGAVFGLHFTKDSVLLTKNDRGWDIPGGRIESAESPGEALRRELLEECGFITESYKAIGILRLNPGTGPLQVPMNVKAYLVSGSNSLRTITASECTAAGYFAINTDLVKNSAKVELLTAIFKRQHRS